MPKQIVIGTEDRPIKYHGQVKFVVFECNNCHKHFAKQESYFRKQLKTRENACCFCSAGCRTTYHAKRNFIEKAYTAPQPQPAAQPVPAPVAPPPVQPQAQNQPAPVPQTPVPATTVTTTPPATSVPQSTVPQPTQPVAATPQPVVSQPAQPPTPVSQPAAPQTSQPASEQKEMGGLIKFFSKLFS